MRWICPTGPVPRDDDDPLGYWGGVDDQDTAPGDPGASAPSIVSEAESAGIAAAGAAEPEYAEVPGMDVDASSNGSPEDVAAAQADARAAQAEADAQAAQEFHKKAVDAWDAAERDKNAGTDPGVDAARERTRKALEAAESADPADRDMLRAEADAAKAAERKVLDDRWARTSAEEEDAKNAAGVAENGMNEANAKAAEARQAAGDAQQAADRAADPLGTAADEADKNYAAAQAKEWSAFQERDSDYPAALKASALAREQAEAARAAANAAKDVRSASVIGVDKP